MDVMSDSLWLNQLESQAQVEQLLRAEERNTPDKARMRVDALKNVANVQKSAGRMYFYGGIFSTVFGVPLILLFFGLFMVAIGIYMIWAGRRMLGKIKVREVLLNDGLESHLKLLSSKN